MSQLDQAHANAGLTLLAANLALTVHDGAVPAGSEAPPYVVVYSHVEWPNGEPDNGLEGTSGTCVVRWYCHAVGATAAAARAVGDQVRTSLLDVQPVIANRSCGRIRQESAQPPIRDESLGPVVMDALTVYVLETRPA